MVFIQYEKNLPEKKVRKKGHRTDLRVNHSLTKKAENIGGEHGATCEGVIKR